VEKPERKRPVGRPNRRENNIEIDLEKYLGGVWKAFIGKKKKKHESSRKYANISFLLKTKRDIS
jgi:hypothetical protein